VLAAAREFAAVAATYRGLTDVAAAERRLAELESDETLRRLRKDESWGIAYEKSVWRRLSEIVWMLRQEAAMPALGRLRGRLDVADLLQKAVGEGPRAEAGRRAVATAFAQLAGVQRRELFAARDWPRAALVLMLAAEVRPEEPNVRYNLGCALALSGRAPEALVQLERALDLGVADPAQMATDEDLASLRDEPAFRRLLERARAAGAS
jgi:hypothetical protein